MVWEPEIVIGGLAQPEGPVVLADGSVACVEMARDVTSVTRISPVDECTIGERTVIVRTGGRPNGLAVDASGGFWVAGGPARSVGRYDAQGRLLARIEGNAERSFLFPNDIAFGRDGALYITDSGWLAEDLGRDGRMRPDFKSLPFDGAVVRIDPVTGASTPLVRGLRFTNGIAFDPAGALFVNESVTGAILRVDPDGTTSHYADVSAPDGEGFGPDGMAFAADGTLYCAIYGSGHIAVIPPGGGSVAQRIGTPGRAPTNVAFARNGEPVLYVTEVERGELLRLRVGQGGLALHEPMVAASRDDRQGQMDAR